MVLRYVDASIGFLKNAITMLLDYSVSLFPVSLLAIAMPSANPRKIPHV